MPYANLRVARTFLNRFEADVAKSALHAAGIESVVRADDMGGLRPAMSMGSAVQLLVHSDELERAVEILETDATTRPEAQS